MNLVDCLRGHLACLSPAQFDRLVANAATLFLETVYQIGSKGLFSRSPKEAEAIIDDTMDQCMGVLVGPGRQPTPGTAC
ncbi:hypothetical protein [Sphingobium estronivorans]|uniref:hypothetical protein n=1 Tax=Sphingobium estronivorans TaxID=1577690 RepID=UPI0012398161|nr:hypothetical protein [Sphingobium estronivorans]